MAQPFQNNGRIFRELLHDGKLAHSEDNTKLSHFHTMVGLIETDFPSGKSRIYCVHLPTDPSAEPIVIYTNSTSILEAKYKLRISGAALRQLTQHAGDRAYMQRAAKLLLAMDNK